MLIVEREHLMEAERVFAGTGVKFVESSSDLGGAIGSDACTSRYLTKKVMDICEQV